MKISRYFFITFSIVLLTPFFLFAQETDTQSLIQSLQNQIAALQARITELKVSEEQAPSAFPIFIRDLFRGTKGDDVRKLQEFLTNPPVGGKDIYPEGLISGYFGALTEKAVQRFQAKHNIVSPGSFETAGYGRVGPKTRAKLNALLANPQAPGKVVSQESQQESSGKSPIGEEPSSAPSPPDTAVPTPAVLPPPPTPIATTSAPIVSSPKPAPNIKAGSSSAITNTFFDFGTGVIHYKALGRLNETGAFYLGNTGGGQTSPPVFVANVASPKGSACDPYDTVALGNATGPKSICEFTDAANYTFSNKEELVRFHEKSSLCYDGIVLFRQNGFYGGIEPEDVTKNDDLTYRYWYDASGGSDFSSVCTAGRSDVSPAFASVIYSFADVLENIQREIKKLSR